MSKKPKDGRGGVRAGAGRKAGLPNKINWLSAEAKAAICAAGKDPVEFMIAVMCCDDVPLESRFAAAKEAAPYIRPRLAQIENTGAASVKHEFPMSDNEFARRIALILTGKAATI